MLYNVIVKILIFLTKLTIYITYIRKERKNGYYKASYC